MLQHLCLHRPLVFLDTETTGIDPAHDRIVELGLLRLAPEQQPQSLALLYNPEVPIPAAATAVHGIHDADVAACLPFRAVAARVARWLDGADLAGFNLRKFDLPMLTAEFARAGLEFSLRDRSVVDALTIYHAREPRDLAAAVRLYCDRHHDHAHRALDDATATASVLDAMCARYPDLPRTVGELHQQFIAVDIGGWFQRDGSGAVIFARGKYRNQPLTTVARQAPGYLHWLCRQRLLSDAREFLEQALAWWSVDGGL